MLAMGDTSVKSSYNPLDSWTIIGNGRYRHISNGREVKKLPKEAKLAGETARVAPTAPHSQEDA